MTSKIGLGGSCHWCTEAIFQSIKGVNQVDQGWISSKESPTLSEAVLVTFDPLVISLSVLIEIHLRTHSATSSHPMRKKYRSAIYTFSQDQIEGCTKILSSLQEKFDQPIITQVHHFDSFKLNDETYLNYYTKDPSKPFCKNVIDPKLSRLRKEFSRYVT